MTIDRLYTFYPYQQAWLNDHARFKIAMFARQTGKTLTTCAEIVDDCIKAEIAGTRTRWVILSRGERQAKEAMDEAIKPLCKAFYALYGGLTSDPAFYEDTFKGESSATYKALEVSFPGGSRITALPANPDTARGFSANVFLDEFAFHQDSRAIWKALFPVISKPGLKLRITSTPNGKNNKFYELMTANDNSWSRHIVDIYNAVEQGLERDIDMLRQGMADDEAWAQEYELKWLDEATAWLTYDLITACEDENAGRPELYQGGQCVAGNDIGRRKDLWALAVGEEIGDVVWVRDISKLKNTKFAEHDNETARLFQKYKIAQLCMDQTGMGEKPVEDNQRRYGQYTVTGVLFNNAVKQRLAALMKTAFEDRKIRIPAGDQELRSHLHAIKKDATATGRPRFDADRDSSGHADLFWAIALMLFANDTKGGPVEYETVATRRFGRKREDD